MNSSRFQQEKQLNALKLVEKKEALRYHIHTTTNELRGNRLLEQLLRFAIPHNTSFRTLLKKGKSLLGLSRLMLSFGKRIVHLFGKSHETN